MSRHNQKSRHGPSVREFLRYYVLVLLRKKPMRATNMRRAISRHSRENVEFRPSGRLLVGARDLRLAAR